MQNNSRMASRTKYCTSRIKSFVIPLSNYSVETLGVPVSFFEMLGLLESLKGITSESVASGCVLQSYANGGLTVINATDTRQLASFSAHFTGDADKVQACNIANFGPLTEKTPLQRAEWIKYLGAFANLEVRANAVYDAVKLNYMCLSKSVANQTTRFKPVVAWVQYSQGTWTFAREAHKLQYVTDAGGENIDGTISSDSYSANNTDDMDNFHAILGTVDVVLDETIASDASGYTLSTFMMNINVDDSSCFAFLSNQSLWRYDKRVGNSSALDWSDGAIAQPQLVLADLIEIFFPTGNYSTVYFRNIAKDEGITAIGAEMCDRSASTPMEPTIVPCQ
ncbi:hypothetical protein QJS10_CPA01g00196 [Acorus calamus]|uniref:Uncharacterized protein n=1 Tax=Acorus calamus TaxID=4465 RepID=A0AAV9FTB2_ACOCL|nr:hypothetical protein QJS10_CPA01g00196 [Acorus calamus]